MNLWRHVWTVYQYRQASVKPLKYLKFLKQSQYWDRKRLERYQLEKLKDLLHYAADHTLYYKKIFSDFNFSSFTPSDLHHLPVLTKEVVRENTEDLRSGDKALHIIEASTSGSTGIPLKIYRTKDASAILAAGHFRFHSWWGVQPGDRHAIIWGISQTRVGQRDFIKRLKDKLVNSPLVIDVFDLNEDTIQDYARKMIKYRPVYIRGYVSSIKHFYQLVQGRSVDISSLKPKVIITTSEVLYPHDRAYIESVSGCPVANEYGSRDGGQFAYECPQRGLHIQEEYQYFWINQNNELIGTELNNRAMPLINYQVGDRVVISDDKCACGRTLKILDRIEGRSGDMLLRPDGKYMSSWIFYYIIEELKDLGFTDSIKQFKVIQKGNHFDYLIVKDKNFSDKVTSYIEKRMKEKIGSRIEISFHFPGHIEKEKSGKLRNFSRIEKMSKITSGVR